MTEQQPLTIALARAASRLVGESKVGNRKGSASAVARAMTERGVRISNNTLSRKLAGEYPFDTDDIAALADVLGVTPDEIWSDALRIMASMPSRPADPIRDELEAKLSKRGRRQVQQSREAEAGEGRVDPSGRARVDEDDGRTADALTARTA